MAGVRRAQMSQSPACHTMLCQLGRPCTYASNPARIAGPNQAAETRAQMGRRGGRIGCNMAAKKLRESPQGGRRLREVRGEMVETPLPAESMLLALLLAQDAGVRDGDLRLETSSFEQYRHPLGVCGSTFDTPGIDQPQRTLDRLEGPGDPELRAIGESVPDAIVAADAKVHFRADAGHAVGPPPLHHLRRLRPGGKQPLRRSGNRLPPHQRDRWTGHAGSRPADAYRARASSWPSQKRR